MRFEKPAYLADCTPGHGSRAARRSHYAALHGDARRRRRCRRGAAFRQSRASVQRPLKRYERHTAVGCLVVRTQITGQIKYFRVRLCENIDRYTVIGGRGGSIDANGWPVEI